MPVKLTEKNGGNVLTVQLSGTIVKEDYARFMPEAERLMKEHGKIRVLVDIHDFHGWTAGAAWEDIKFDAKHFNDIERLALVGETQWAHGMAIFCKPFTRAKVRYFDLAMRNEGDAWLEDA